MLRFHQLYNMFILLGLHSAGALRLWPWTRLMSAQNYLRKTLVWGLSFLILVQSDPYFTHSSCISRNLQYRVCIGLDSSFKVKCKDYSRIIWKILVCSLSSLAFVQVCFLLHPQSTFYRRVYNSLQRLEYVKCQGHIESHENHF